MFGLLFVHSALAQWQSVGYVSSYRVEEPNSILVQAGRSALHISLLAPDLVRIRLAPNGAFASDQSVAIVKRDWQGIKPIVTQTPAEIRIATSEITVVVKKSPLRISFLDHEGNIINQDDREHGMSWDGKAVRVWKDMPVNENYYGFGEKSGSLNRKYKHMTMWNTDIPAYKADTDPLYQSIPFFYGVRNGKAYGIFFDNSYWSSFDMGKEFPEKYSFGATGGELNYYFFYGPSPKKILTRYTELVGRMQLPPRWSLGYQQCRWSYYPESRVRKLAKDFRSKKIPADVIYLDIDYMEGYRIFTFSQKNFPQPKKMISDLAKDGFKIAVIVDPGIKADSSYHAFQSGIEQDVFLKYPNNKLFIGKVWPGECAFPDFSNPVARTWWGENFNVLVDAGVRGFWNDMNEPSVFDVPTKTVDLNVIHNDNSLLTPHAKNHNTYGMQMTQATYEGVRKLRPTERPFVLTRASYAGGQRYSAAWTGDNVASWEHLELALPMLLNLSISGQPFVGSDIGGFIGSPEGELFARWLQLGVFSPLMRAHTVINSADQEPWSYGATFEAINRKTIELRYRLLPYIYTTMYQASLSGIPAMRPLVLEYPEDESYGWNGTEFLFGDDILVAPVLWRGETKRELRLPKGVWYDYWTNDRYDGGKNVTVNAPVDRIPMFVKAGSIIPSQQVVQYTDQAPIDPLTLTVYPAKGVSSSLYYEDDWHTFEYEQGKFFKRTITQTNTGRSVKLVLGEAAGSYVPRPRFLAVRFVDVSAEPRQVLIGGEKISKTDEARLLSSKQGWT
ncbi:MAG: glycoside hydrolase family 31 protein, partial [Ignavibacteriales bacterium]|nr:glycoside hydrolase family 31 protein [Ignavibacteriales bacterium]